MNKKIYIGMLFSSMLLAACGGSSATDPEATANSFPVCDVRNEGQTMYVSQVSRFYICEDGDWTVLPRDYPNASTDEDNLNYDDVENDKSSSSVANFVGKSSESHGANTDGYYPSTGIFTDSRDGKTYKTVKIDDQVWMAENLNIKTEGSGCYNNDPAKCEKYGCLYTWDAAQKACPAGWHLPSKEEFESLLATVGSSSEERSLNLRAGSWENGVDRFVFSALPAGVYDSSDEWFVGLGSSTVFWSSAEHDSYDAYYLVIDDSGTGVRYVDKINGLSVRCLQNAD